MTSAEPGRLKLLGRFAIEVDDGEPSISDTCRRLIAFVALQAGPIARERAAGSLWPDEAHDRAGARLRTALSRVKTHVPWLLTVTHDSLALRADVPVDYRRACDEGRQLVEIPGAADPDLADIRCFDHDLLPDWYDEWLVQEREAFRQLRFAALEAIADAALRARQTPRAVQACLAVVGAEPLRESAHRLLIRAHAADGNLGEALRQVDRYARLLRTELGVPPSSLMIDLRESLVGDPRI